MAKVLMLLTNPFRPDPRVHKEGKALVAAGHQVKILAWDRPGGAPSKEGVDGIQLHRFGPPSGWGATMSVVPGMTLFWGRAALAALSERPDVVHAHDFDTLPLGWLVSKISGAKLVYDAHEGYADMVGPSVPPWVARLINTGEARMARKAELVIAVNELFREEFSSKGCGNVVVIANLPESYGRADPVRVEALRKEMGAEGKKLVLYVGVLEPQRALVDLVNAVRALPADGYALAIGGFGTLEAQVLKAAEGMTNFKFLGRVPGNEILDYSAAADVLFAVYDPSNPNNRKGAPNKLYEAIHLGKPIIVAEGTFAARESALEGIGLPVKYGSVESISDRIKSAAVGGAPFPANRSKEAGAELRTWAGMAERLVKAYVRMLEGGS
ncbi:MAG: glycosyltransferase family 4 protein [Methanobacteriota archaeon]